MIIRKKIDVDLIELYNFIINSTYVYDEELEEKFNDLKLLVSNEIDSNENLKGVKDVDEVKIFKKVIFEDNSFIEEEIDINTIFLNNNIVNNFISRPSYSDDINKLLKEINQVIEDKNIKSEKDIKVVEYYQEYIIYE